LVDTWLRGLGGRLAAASDDPKQDFTFFMMDDRQVNAFATVGGYIGVNAGLVLVAESEDEVAGVIGHEIAHVTQTHVLRSVERAQRDSVPILLAMLGAIAIAQSGSSSSGDAAMAAMASAQGIAAQRQINYTRSNEPEADRIGIRTLARSGYDPAAMAGMFERMHAVSRTNQGGERERLPDYLKTHPVTTTRISEAKDRAERLGGGTVQGTVSTPEGSLTQRIALGGASVPDSLRTIDNPLLPAGVSVEAGLDAARREEFGCARERLRVLSANTADAAIREYERIAGARELDDAQRYGLAIAQLRAGRGEQAATALAALMARHPGDVWLTIGLAEAEAHAGRHEAADRRFEALLERMPRHPAVALSYADVLVARNTPEAGRRARDVLRPLLSTGSGDPAFQRTYARASEIAGDPVRAGEAWAEAAYLSGREEQALVQLNTLKKRDDLDYYARARIDARIAQITPVVLELRRQGVRDPDLNRRL